MVSPEEIMNAFNPEQIDSKIVLRRRADEMIRINKQRRERDNISVALIRTY
jgi:serine/threonine protein phosphatase PrpC